MSLKRVQQPETIVLTKQHIFPPRSMGTNPMDMYVDEPDGVALFNMAKQRYFGCYEDKSGDYKFKCISSEDHKTPKTQLLARRESGSGMFYNLRFDLGCWDGRARFLWITWWGKVECYKGRFSAKV
jgi:hypothetical protein